MLSEEYDESEFTSDEKTSNINIDYINTILNQPCKSCSQITERRKILANLLSEPLDIIIPPGNTHSSRNESHIKHNKKKVQIVTLQPLIPDLISIILDYDGITSNLTSFRIGDQVDVLNSKA